MPAASRQLVRLLTQQAARSPPHPAWRYKGVEDAYCWGTLPGPLCLSQERHRTSTRVQASQPLLVHHWMSLQSREAPREH